MNHKTRATQLLRETFWQLEDLSDNQLTSKYVRSFLIKHIRHDILTHYLLGLSGSTFWLRVISVIYTHLEARK